MIWNSIFFQLNIEYWNYKFKILNNDKFLYITKEILSQVYIKNLISNGTKLVTFIRFIFTSMLIS